MPPRGYQGYRSMEEFEREEIRSSNKIGFSLDDLFQEATLHPIVENLDEPEELDF